MNEKEEIVQKIVKILKKEHITYDESKYIIKRVRSQLEIQPSKRAIKLPKFVSKDDIESMLNFAYKKSPKDALILKTLFTTGIRVSELVNLKIKDVNFQDNKINIIEGKGRKDRVVLINNNLKQELIFFLNERSRGYVFETNRNAKYSSRRIQQIIKDLAHKSKINKEVTPHIIRHTIATYWLNSGMKLDQVQLLLGHSSPVTTEIYAKTSLESVKEKFKEVMD